MKRARKSGFHSYNPEVPASPSGTDSTETSSAGSPAKKSPRRDRSRSCDSSQAAFDFLGFDQTFALDRSEELFLGMGGGKKGNGGKGTTPQKGPRPRSTFLLPRPQTSWQPQVLRGLRHRAEARAELPTWFQRPRRESPFRPHRLQRSVRRPRFSPQPPPNLSQ
jgi:hypothetical protein